MGYSLMAATKPIEKYIQEIKDTCELIEMYPDSDTLQRRLYTRLSAWEKLTEISVTHTPVACDPTSTDLLIKKYIDSEKRHRKLDDSLEAWADELDLTIYQSPQEQYPWTEDKLGDPIKIMHTKSVSDIDETGDYTAFYSGGGYSGWIGFVVERKGAKGKGGPNDLYQTLSNKESRERFYREIDRFKADKRFTQMFLIAECTLDEFLKYVPVFSGYKTRNIDHKCVSVATREATIAGLEIRGCHVIWAGNRARAMQMYRDLNRQWLLKKHAQVLGIETKNKTIQEVSI